MKWKHLAILAASVLAVATIFVVAEAQPVRDEAYIKYRLDKWSYEHAVRNLGSKSQGEFGALSYADKSLDAGSLPALRVNDYLHTPWGTLYWWGSSSTLFGGHGWLAYPKAYKPAGKRLTPPDAQPGFILLARADHATTVALAPGNQLGIRLPALAPDGREWAVKSGTGEILQLVTPPIPRIRHLPGWDALNQQVFQFRAVKPGRATLVMRHGGDSDMEWKVNIEVGDQ